VFLPILAVSALVVVGLRHRREGWTLAHWRNDLVAIFVLAAFVRIFLRIVAL